MTTVVHKNSTTSGNVPATVTAGEIAINSADRVAFIKNSAGTTTKLFDQYSKTEADSRYVPSGILPVSRIGDTPYLPLDVKGDFKGSVVPSRSTYMLREPDGSVAGLRPGYNGNKEQAFYFYSQSGRVELESDFVYTDTPYTPNFLRNDSTAVEYVQFVNNCNQWGFLAGIGSTLSATYRRWYWINTNGTLDPAFHSYVDVTDTFNATPLSALQYVKEFGGFIGTMFNKIRLLFFANNLPVNWVNNPSPSSTTLTAKSVNCVDPIAGTTAAATAFLNYDYSNYTAIYKPIATTAGGATFQSLSIAPQADNDYTLVYQPSDGGTSLSMFVPYSIYHTYSTSGTYSTLIVRLRYNITTNTISWYVQGNDAQNQTFPFVYDPYTYGSENTTSTGDTTSDAYKKNKYPITYASSPDGNLYHSGTVDAYNFIDSTTVATVSNVYSYFEFGLVNIDVSTSTATNKLTAFTDRPYLMRGNTTYNQTLRSKIIFYPYDASVLGKSLRQATFISQYRLGVDTLSRLYGTSISEQKVMVTYPSTTVSRTLDGASSPNALPLPSSTTLLSAVSGVSSIPEMNTYYHLCNTIIYSNGDYRVMPYGAEPTTLIGITSNLNSLVVKVVDGSSMTYDATRGGSAGIAIYPTDVTTKIPALLLTYATSSACGFTSPSTTAKKYCMHYIGDYVNGATTYGLCLLQYVIQEVGTKTESGWVTLRLVKTGTQMAFSTLAASDVVTAVKITDTSTTTGNITSASYSQPTIGILQYTDGRWFVESRNCARGYPGSINNVYSTFEIAADGTISRNKAQYEVNNSYYGMNAGVHPDLGPITYQSRYDYSQARISYNSWPVSTTGAVDKNYVTFNGKLAGTLVTPTTNWLLTVETAQGFNLYVTQFSVFLNGRSYTVPTMSIDLSTIVADPSSKTFYVYLHAIDANTLNMEIQTTTSDEAFDKIFAGTITTNTTSISAVTLQKATRLDLYRPYHKTYVGSAMPVPV